MMDELAESLATSFSVSNEPNTTAAQHPRFAQYKQKGGVDQDVRRKRILDEQKDRRMNYMNLVRHITDDTWDGSELGDDQEEMDQTEAPVKLRKPGRFYRNQLMLSEWLVEVPPDFAEEWVMVMCPWGKRCLVVAARGSTSAYNKAGYQLGQFPSQLPGGNRKQQGKYRDNAILDCIYHEVEKTFYVIDIMCWKDHPVYDSEAEFRFFWLHSKFADCPEATTVANINPYKFVPLKAHPCTKESLGSAIQSVDYVVDGMLFYHKRTHYTFGSTPLVVWLKPWMIPEILEVEVPEAMMDQKPANYTNYEEHMKHVKEEQERFAKQRERGSGDANRSRGAGRRSTGKKAREYKMDLMMSKWFLEVPEKFEEDWVMVVCPVGRRCLLVAAEGETITFAKTGHKMPGYFVSLLPGGNRRESRDSLSMFDCIYVESTETYFILDTLYWDEQPIHKKMTTERFSFMKQALFENPAIREVSMMNHHKISCLKNYPCSQKGIEEGLKSTHFEVDGLLFFDKNIPYESGTTDQVLWLKPYMLPDIFEGIKVPKTLVDEKPESYENFEKHVENIKLGIDSEPKKKKKPKKKKSSQNEGQGEGYYQPQLNEFGFLPLNQLNLSLTPEEYMAMQRGRKAVSQKQKLQQLQALSEQMLVNRGQQQGMGYRGPGGRERGRNMGQGQGGGGMGRGRNMATMAQYQNQQGGEPWSRGGSMMGQGQGQERGRMLRGERMDRAGNPWAEREFYDPSYDFGLPGGRQGMSEDAFEMSDMKAALAMMQYQNQVRRKQQQYFN